MHAFTAGNLASAAKVSTTLERTLRNARTRRELARSLELARLIVTLLERAENLESLNTKEGTSP